MYFYDNLLSKLNTKYKTEFSQGIDFLSKLMLNSIYFSKIRNFFFLFFVEMLDKFFNFIISNNAFKCNNKGSDLLSAKKFQNCV